MMGEIGKKHGDVTGIEVWCEPCKKSHSISLDVIISVAARGETEFTGLFVANIFTAAAAIIDAATHGKKIIFGVGSIDPTELTIPYLTDEEVTEFFKALNIDPGIS